MKLTFRSLLVLILLASPALALDLTGPGRVIDGDTLEVAGQKVRLFGIDAPEHDQTCDRGGKSWACGQFSTQVLRDLVARGPLRCTVQDKDRYGRAVSICVVGGQDIGRLMVRAGAAEAYRRYSDRYVRDEGAAKAAGTGIWAGHMVTPEAFRHSDVSPPPPDGCTIKGNIGSSGKIYHMPGQRDYAATRINEARGEAWFCTEAQARAAGFRRARR